MVRPDDWRRVCVGGVEMQRREQGGYRSEEMGSNKSAASKSGQPGCGRKRRLCDGRSDRGAEGPDGGEGDRGEQHRSVLHGEEERASERRGP